MFELQKYIKVDNFKNRSEIELIFLFISIRWKKISETKTTTNGTIENSFKFFFFFLYWLLWINRCCSKLYLLFRRTRKKKLITHFLVYQINGNCVSGVFKCRFLFWKINLFYERHAVCFENIFLFLYFYLNFRLVVFFVLSMWLESFSL